MTIYTNGSKIDERVGSTFFILIAERPLIGFPSVSICNTKALQWLKNSKFNNIQIEYTSSA